MKRQKGVTLLELMIVVAIVAIISMFAVPSYKEAQRKARISEGIAALSDAQAQIERYRLTARQPYSAITLALANAKDKVEYSGKTIYTITYSTTVDSNGVAIPASDKYVLTAIANTTTNNWIGKNDESCRLIMNGAGALTKTTCK